MSSALSQKPTKKTILLWLTAAGVAIAFVTLLLSLSGDDTAPAATDASANSDVGNTSIDSDQVSGDQVGRDQVSGDGNVIAGDGSNISLGDVDTSNPEAVRAALAEVTGADADPDGAPPYSYVVVGTEGFGLVVRTGYTADDSRLDGEPSFAEGEGVYADCQVKDGWQPAQGSTTWLKVRWPEPRDVGDYWVNAEWALPFGHNGNIPPCRAESD